MRVARLRAVAIANLRVSRRFVYYPRWRRRGVSAPSMAVDTLDNRTADTSPLVAPRGFSRNQRINPMQSELLRNSPHRSVVAREGFHCAHQC
jgi:hypothetical protein